MKNLLLFVLPATLILAQEPDDSLEVAHVSGVRSWVAAVGISLTATAVPCVIGFNAGAGEDTSRPSRTWYSSRLPQPGRHFVAGINTDF